MGVVAAVVAVAGAAYGGYAQHEAGRKQAAIDKKNAEYAQMQAEDAIKRGQDDEQRFRAGLAKFAGAQRAGLAGQGLDVSFGTAEVLQQQTAYLGELDALTIRNNAAREAWGYRTQSWNYAQQAGQSVRAGTDRAISTIIGGAGQAYGYMYGRK